MFRPLVRSHRRPLRRGTAILITCFFLITIMMVTGLALVMYAAREKAAALAYQDAIAVPAKVAPDPTNTVNAFFSSLTYDVGNGELANGTDLDPASRDLHNALRGHSIARSMYGSNPTGQPGWTGSTTPWAGVGLFREVTGGAGGYTYQNNPASIYASLAGIDRGQIVNQTALPMDGQFLLIDPEWTRSRFPATPGTNLPVLSTSLSGRSYVGKHAGYTFPDLKNFFLGARDPYTGEVLVQSFHRDWLFRHTSQTATESSLAPTNPNWSNDAGRLLTLRPRRGSVQGSIFTPAEHPNFPHVPPNADGTYTGDVQNCPGSYVYVPGTGGNPGRFVARNDSLWMHIGLAPITLPDGRRVQPLVAPLILPLDGSFDLSSHGNMLGTAAAHHGHGGYGPWEVNINSGIVTGANSEINRQALITQRKHTPSRSAQFAPFASGQLLPRYAPVAWNGSQVQFQPPVGNSMLGLPTSGNALFTPGFGNFQNDNALLADHPAAYNRDEFGPRGDIVNPISPVYPYTDLKRFGLRYAFTPDWYVQAFATKSAQDTFLGLPTTYPYFATPTATALSNYRLDPAHTRRLLFTPKASALDRPALAPNFVNRGDGTGLALPTPTLVPTDPTPPASAAKPGGLFAGAPVTAYPAPQAVGTITDFAGDNRWYNVQAALGSVNLNRPLADYRTDINQPLIRLPLTDATRPVTDPANASNLNTDAASVALADKDRQALAKDIFARLIIATGAAAQVSFDQTNGVQIALPAPATDERYNALRYLAQLAVNIVDHIDNDDVSTVFQWNPTNQNDLPTGRAADVADAANRVVFGVEKPRVVLNEAYGEITNDQADAIDGADMGGGVRAKPTGPINVRFWVELLNPTQAMTPGGVLGDGSVPLSAYTIQIRRETRKTGEMAANQDPNVPGTPGSNQEPFLFGTASFSNTSGAFDLTHGLPDATFELSRATTPSGLLVPNESQYSQPNLPARGVILVGPPTPGKTDSEEFTPSGGVWTGMIQSPALQAAKAAAGGMGYTFPLPDANTTFSDREFKRHIVLLRRVANPYLLPNDPLTGAYNSALPANPYVTVDVMDYVPAFDAVHRGKEDGANRNVRPGAPNGYDPVGQRFSVGKVQPLAGYASARMTDGAGNYNEYSFNAPAAPVGYSMVLPQKGAPSLPPAPMMPTPRPNEPGANTFGRHNGTLATQPTGTTVTNTGTVAATLGDTLMLPFDWLPHMDRPLETAGDLFTVRDCKPHQLTADFVRNGTTGLAFGASYARWTQHNNGLARALELLTVKSPAPNVAHGGRVSGKLNPNVIQDPRIAQGIWDPQPGNRFNQTFVDGVVWEKWMRSRSLLQAKTREDGTNTFNSPVPRVSVLDRNITNATNPGLDRPFLPYGAPTATSNGFAYDSPNTTTADGDTILRIDSTLTTPQPFLQLSATGQVALTAGEDADATLKPILQQKLVNDAYVRTEPLRKVMNNLTTVSHSFVVYLTIGYFEYEGLQSFANWPANVPQPPRFGAEVYDQIPGDMRQKFVGVIDMSNMALNLNLTSPAPASGQPFFTALTATARPAASVTLTLASGTGNGTTYSIMADGQIVTVAVGDALVLGYGSDVQVVSVQSVGTAGPTANQITVTGLTRTVWGGTCVSNVRPGYVGPQGSGFNINLPMYKPVVPYVERLR